jgi:nucleoside-diphosphate-sugar epimerase
LGEALIRVLASEGSEVVGFDVLESEATHVVGTITDRPLVRERMSGVDAVINTATLHKPHLLNRARQKFVDTNATGTVALLEETTAARVGCFVFTSTTSLYGRPTFRPSADGTVWIASSTLSVLHLSNFPEGADS